MTSSDNAADKVADFRLADFGRDLLTRDAAAQVAAVLRETMLRTNRVRVDFRGVETMTPSFADECFGRLAEELGREQFRRRLELVGADAELRTLVNVVLRYRLQRRDAAPGVPAGSATPAAKEFEVRSAAEFLEAIGPNRIITIMPGTMDLGVEIRHDLPRVGWRKEHDGLTLVIRDIENMTIRGSEERGSRLVVAPRYTHVLAFERCRNITLQTLTMGHAPAGYCTGGVVRAAECALVTITDCNLFGCGTEGLTLDRVQAFRMEGGAIFECTYGIATLSTCSDVECRGVTFRHNRQFHGFVADDSVRVNFVDCRVLHNECEGPLFDVRGPSPVRFLRGEIAFNAYADLGTGVETSDTSISGNRVRTRTEG